jgi:[lysine-biosynthesis-protein LysW]---L-2-aminoadipate ligase
MFALIAHRSTPANDALVAAPWPGATSDRLAPQEAVELLRPGDIALGRLDVRGTVDGVEPGLGELASLSSLGVTVLNPPPALLAAHDKLQTARVLMEAGVAHPATAHYLPGHPLPAIEPPVVVKPRFGSWGRDVYMCGDLQALSQTLERLEERDWFHTQGVLLQALIPPRGYDIRVVVAGGRVVGAIERLAAPGEWRTNVALGATRAPVTPRAAARKLALAAAGAAGADLVGVDLLPVDGGYVVLELNGAVDFTPEYAFGDDVFRAAISALAEAAEAPPDLARITI